MQTQFIFRIVLAVLVIEYAHANAEYSRGDFTYRLFPTKRTLLIDDLNKNLERLGLAVDENSEVILHHEETYIDLSCFNCIIINLPNNIQEMGPGNDFIIK